MQWAWKCFMNNVRKREKRYTLVDGKQTHDWVSIDKAQCHLICSTKHDESVIMSKNMDFML